MIKLSEKFNLKIIDIQSSPQFYSTNYLESKSITSFQAKDRRARKLLNGHVQKFRRKVAHKVPSHIDYWVVFHTMPMRKMDTSCAAGEAEHKNKILLPNLCRGSSRKNKFYILIMTESFLLERFNFINLNIYMLR